MILKDQLRAIAFENDMDFFGVGSVDRWTHAPSGRRPGDFLPEARSVVVMGIRIPQGAIESNHRAYENGLRHGIFTYMVFGYNKLNEVLDKAAMKVGLYLEREAKRKVYFIPSSIPRDEYLMMGEMSNRHSAVCAGLGEFGWNGLVLTPEAGPRVRWVQLISDLEIEPDPLYHGPRLCDRSKCRVCVDVCPVQAFSEEEAVELTIGDRKYAYSKLNRPLCRCGVTGLAAGTAGRLQEVIPAGTVNNVEDWLAIAVRDDRWNRMERVASMCGRCLTTCPAGLTYS
jgi:epoxyqueuosine reductase